MTYPVKWERLSIKEYLEMEEDSAIRHEYIAGEIFAMAGSTEAHNVISLNIATAVRSKIRGTGCRVFIFDMKARVEATDAFYYPDIMATCEPFVSRSVFKSRPFLVVEVLSPSTAQIDRREKKIAYGKLDSVQEYLIVHQNQRKIEIHRKDGEGKWQSMIVGGSDSVPLESLPNGPFMLSLDDVYEDVSFSENTEEE